MQSPRLVAKKSLALGVLRPGLASTGALTFSRARTGSMPQVPSVRQLAEIEPPQKADIDPTDLLLQQKRESLERYRKERYGPVDQNKAQNGPMTSATAIERFRTQLSHYEKMEILEYKYVYCLGLGAKKLNTDLNLPNGGFDDERGDYRALVGDHIAYRYEVMAVLGRGNFGIVLRCFDHKQRETIALKILRNNKRFPQQGTVEIRVLELLKDRDLQGTMPVVQLKESFRFRKHLCLSFELLGNDLLKVLQENDYRGMAVSFVKGIAYQLLSTLKYIKELRIIHCDIKPENILLEASNRSSVKLIDFGSACYEISPLFAYIQSRFYRAPEVILGAPYSFPIDIWSLGCVLAEMCTGRPLFHGEDEKDQIQGIMEILGPPPDKFLSTCTRKGLFFEEDGEPKLTANSKGRIRYPSRRTLEEAVPGVEKGFLAFLSESLQWDPKMRLTPEEGLGHPWMRR